MYGWIIYILMIRRVIERDMFTSLLATFGLAIVMAQLMNLIFGWQAVTADSGLGIRSLFGVMVPIAEIKVVSLVLCALVDLVIVLFIKRSRMGQAIRDTAQKPRAAQVKVIDTDRVFAFSFTLYLPN